MPPDTVAACSGVMLRRGLAVAVLSVAGIAAASTAASAADVAEGAEYEPRFETERDEERLSDDDDVVVVEQGDTLSGIAADVGLDSSQGWRVLFDANEKIDDPDLIMPSQELEVPEEGDVLERRGTTAGAPATENDAADPEPAAEESTDPEPAAEESTDSEPAAEEPAAEEPAAEEPEAEEPAPAESGSTAGDGVWDRLAQCESSGDWSINTGNGYYGGLQFHPDTWAGHGGHEYAPNAHQATREQQIAIAERVLQTQGWGAWPACSSQLGLR